MNHDITRIAVSGSLQARSKNLALLTTAAHVAPPRVDFVLFDGIRDLPHFNPELEASAVPSRIGLRVWTASADGQKVMVTEEFGSETARPLTLMQNWIAGIRK